VNIKVITNNIKDFILKLIYARRNSTSKKEFNKQQQTQSQDQSKRREFLRKAMFGVSGVAIGSISSIAQANHVGDPHFEDPDQLRRDLDSKADKDLNNVSSLPASIRSQLMGPKGDKGDVGSKGDKGDVGSKGSQGSKGDKGDVGAKFSMSGTTLNITT